jgi:hypothetical protein
MTTKPEKYGAPEGSRVCKWCAGSILWTDDEWKCLSCGRVFKDPGRQGNVQWKGPHGMSAKKPAGGKSPAGIPAAAGEKPRPAVSLVPPVSFTLPMFPRFSDTMKPVTQVAWLNAWAAVTVATLNHPATTPASPARN